MTAVFQPALADEVLLTSGERFTSSKVWEENGKVMFDMQGLIVSVNKEDVTAIISSDGNLPHSAVPPGHPSPARIEPSLFEPEKNQVAKPVPKEVPPKASPENQSLQKPKVRGIGLDGLAWQMNPKEINGIEKLGTDPSYGGIDQYWWPDGNLTLGDVLLDGLVFGFWHNRLYSIIIWVNGKPGYERLQQAVFNRYGPGRKNKKGLDRYVWIDDTTDRMLEFDPRSNTGIFWMRSRNLDQQVKQLYQE